MKFVSKVVSRDGTPIGFERVGRGPALILVDGALCYRASGPSRPLAAALSPHFTVSAYDRRGRGESGATPPYAVDREVDDIEALIREAGGAAFVYGVSSGAALALEAANRRLPIRRLAVYEAPFIVDATRPPIPEDFLAKLDAAVAEGRRGDAVVQFMKLVGVPPAFIFLMRLTPVWRKLTAVAHTLPYDIRIVHDHQRGRPLPADGWSRIQAPTLVLAGGKSEAWLRNGMDALAGVVPTAQRYTLAGQNHMVSPKALAPVLVQFFDDGVPLASRRAS
jgi:hypothetical protein